ncbi:MAG TPA: protein translocase subunit SecF, partial [Acidimicrobiales bacterium]|nr:protein translocase subunit SecF [Acidimicrobiales bacterium]
AIGLVALGVRGLNLSIDFRGGTVWEVPITKCAPGACSVGGVRGDLGAINASLSQSTITQLTNRQTHTVDIEVEARATTTSNAALVDKVTAELAKIAHVPTDNVTLNAIGPSWGSDILSKMIEAVVVFVVIISLAIAVYFETKMAIGAFVALLHDMLVTIGIYALSGFQVSPDTVIAFLTVLGYSLYDTIVVFDKVKENTRGLASTNRVTYTDVVNLSMNQVLARSINTSFVAIMPVLCILVIGAWILGATALNDFGLALFIGLTSGAYSSIFIASPILALLKEREPRYAEIRRRLAAYPQARQILTPAAVAAGRWLAGVDAGSGVGGAIGRGSSGGRGSSAGWGAIGGWDSGGDGGGASGRVGGGVGSARYRGSTGAANRPEVAPSDGEGEGPAAAEAREREDQGVPPRAKAGAKSGGARRPPPRPRKKVPRRR